MQNGVQNKLVNALECTRVLQDICSKFTFKTDGKLDLHEDLSAKATQRRLVAMETHKDTQAHD